MWVSYCCVSMFFVFILINLCFLSLLWYFFFNDTATTEIYTYLHTLSLHDALPISLTKEQPAMVYGAIDLHTRYSQIRIIDAERSEEHTSELQSLVRISYAVFCLKKKTETK